MRANDTGPVSVLYRMKQVTFSTMSRKTQIIHRSITCWSTQIFGAYTSPHCQAKRLNVALLRS